MDVGVAVSNEVKFPRDLLSKDAESGCALCLLVEEGLSKFGISFDDHKSLDSHSERPWIKLFFSARDGILLKGSNSVTPFHFNLSFHTISTLGGD